MASESRKRGSGDGSADVYAHGMAAEAARMLTSTLQGVVIRHTRRDDIADIAHMLQQQRQQQQQQHDDDYRDDDDDDDCAASDGVWCIDGTVADVAALVETSVMSLTALCRARTGKRGDDNDDDDSGRASEGVDDNDKSDDGDDDAMAVCGVLVLGDSPRALRRNCTTATTATASAPLHWEETLRRVDVTATALCATTATSSMASRATTHTMCSCNTLWLSLLATRAPARVRAERRSSSSCRAHDNDHDHDDDSHVTATPLARELLRIALGVHAQVRQLVVLVPPHARVPPLSVQPHAMTTTTASRNHHDDKSKNANDSHHHHHCATMMLPCDCLPWPCDDAHSDGDDAVVATSRQLWRLPRSRVLPPLHLRAGRVEDYDDFVPLLLRGRGVLTRLPAAFHLDEKLMQQDDQHKVVIAEDAQTHAVVGMACLRALDAAAQHHLTRRYHTHAVGTFAVLDLDATVRHARARARATSTATSACANAFQIGFLYVDPAYDDRVGSFVQYMFAQFAACEYAVVALPHDTADTPVLRDFAYVPLRSYQPPPSATTATAVSRNNNNNSSDDKDVDDEAALQSDAMGLWVCCRYAFDDVNVEAVCTRDARSDLEEALLQHFDQHAQHMQQQQRQQRQQRQHAIVGDATAALLCDDLQCSFDEAGCVAHGAHDAPLPHTTVFALRWRGSGGGGDGVVVGAASLRRLTLRDVYALRANYDLDAYVDVHALPTHGQSGSGGGGPRDYRATDVTLSPRQARQRARTHALRGVVVRALYVRPAFRAALRFFVRDMLRLVDAHIAVVLAGGGGGDAAVDAPPPSLHPLLAELLPVRPRRVREQRQHDDDDDDDEAAALSPQQQHARDAIDHTTDVAALGALFCTTRRYLADAKLRVHTRIVVVGASATGLACLHRLLMVPYVHFSNLVLISSYGLPAHANAQAVQWHADTMTLLEREHACLHVGRPVRVVAGSMRDLDRAQRYVALDSGGYEAYDYLLLTVGRQYVVPPTLHALLQQEGRTVKTTTATSTTTATTATATAANGSSSSTANSDSGILPLADELAMDQLRQRLADIDQNVHNVANVMVYGAGLDALATVTAMVQLGFSAQRIVLCSREEAVPYMDAASFATVVSLLKSMGMHVMRGYDVTRIEYDEDGHLCTVVLAPTCVAAASTGSTTMTTTTTNATAAGQAVELACCLIVTVEDKDIDQRVLTTLNRRSIVFDGRVIVESNYRASDARILAAGPVAMFTRRYGATRSFDDSAARDVGEHMARVLLGTHLRLDEFRDAITADDENEHDDKNNTNDAATTIEVYRKVLEENGSVAARRRARHACVSPAQRERAARATLQRLPRYRTPLARRLRLPAGCCYFAALSVDFRVDECMRLDCSNMDVQRLLATHLRSHNNNDNDDDSHDDDDDDDKAATSTTTAAVAAKDTEQYMLTIYVNEHSRAIDAVMYLGNGRPEVHHYYTLIGYPESLLNLVYRYREAATLAATTTMSTTTTTMSRHAGASAAGLTAGVVGGKLDLVAYLRLPHLQCIFDERFDAFFRALRERLRAHAQAMQLRKRILHEHRLECYLPETTASAYVSTLTQSGHGAFARDVQLQLLRFLHENKDFLPQHLYLPDITAHVGAHDAAVPQPSP